PEVQEDDVGAQSLVCDESRRAVVSARLVACHFQQRTEGLRRIAVIVHNEHSQFERGRRYGDRIRGADLGRRTSTSHCAASAGQRISSSYAGRSPRREGLEHGPVERGGLKRGAILTPEGSPHTNAGGVGKSRAISDPRWSRR